MNEIEAKQPSNKRERKVQDGSAKTLPDKVKAEISYMALGKLDGDEILKAEVGAFKTIKEKLIQRAKELAFGLGMEDGKLHLHCRDWLDGVGSIVGKVRKAEYGAIMVASTIGDKELVVTEKTEEGKPVVKETHTGMEWLESCTSYGQLVRMARNVRGSEGRQNKGGSKRTELHSSTLGKVEETIKGASVSQAAVIAQDALNVIGGSKEGERMFFVTIQGICIRLRASQDEAIKKAASEMEGIAANMIGRLAVAPQVAAAPIPQPAQAPVPEVAAGGQKAEEVPLQKAA
jgi:hypothetical protein